MLFCLAEDFLSRKITSLVNSGSLIPMNGPSNVVFPSHLFYINDILIFCKASYSNIAILTSVFETYGLLSGQRVNWVKSEMFLSSGIPIARANALRTRAGMCPGTFPFTYLGVPMFVGAPKARWLKPTADHILAKMDS